MLKSFKRLIGRGEVASPATSSRRRIDMGDRNPPYPIYAIGDVHGCLDLLKEAEAEIAADILANQGSGLIILLGDCIDRGPDSAGVLEYLLQPPPDFIRRVVLCGNHEDTFLRFIRAPLAHRHWLQHGGDRTLRSYGIDLAHFTGRLGVDERRLMEALSGTIPPAHIAFLEALPIYLRLGAYLFVHAGVSPGVPLAAQSDEDLLWIREPFLSRGPRLPFLVVHGHTPAARPQTGPGRIGIDTDAVTTGRLTVLKLSEGTARILNGRPVAASKRT